MPSSQAAGGTKENDVFGIIVSALFNYVCLISDPSCLHEMQVAVEPSAQQQLCLHKLNHGKSLQIVCSLVHLTRVTTRHHQRQTHFYPSFRSCPYAISTRESGERTPIQEVVQGSIKARALLGGASLVKTVLVIMG